MNMLKNLPPYPRLGECYRTLALALDTKASNRDVDRLAREGDHDWSLLSKLNEELILAPLRKYVEPDFAHVVGQWLGALFSSYRELILTVTLDSLGRKDALRLLISNYFALHALGLIYDIRARFGGPELPRLLDPAQRPIAVVLEWLDEREGTPLAKVAFPGTVEPDRSDHEMVRKWARGADLPDLISIKKFADAVEKNGSVSKEKARNLRRWLVTARALTYLEKKSFEPFRGDMLRYLLLGMPEFDIRFVLSTAVLCSGERFAALKIPALTVYEDLKRATPKEAGDQKRTRLAIDELERLTAEHEPEGNTRFHLEWMNARWNVLSGQFENALPHYEGAVELGSHRAGEMLKPILEEALALAAYLRKKPLVKRLKNRAVAIGFFSNPQGEAVIEDWEVEQISQQFHRLFPSQGRFQEARQVEDPLPQLGVLLFEDEKFQNLRPDLDNPDRTRTVRFPDGQIRRWSQLQLFTILGRAEEVAALLRRGASVDQLDALGGSALLCAINYAVDTGDRQALDLLLQKKHDRKTLDSATAKKRLTPLICAIDYGDPDVVGKLLEMGATPDRRGHVDDQTPLYHVMGILGSVRHPAKLYQLLLQSLSNDPDLMHREVMRRYVGHDSGVFGDGRGLRDLRNEPREKQIFDALMLAMVKRLIAQHSASKLIRIAELLLESKANPNAPHQYPALGRTPLMLAAENNSAAAFDLMMRRGGNPYQQDAAGLDCAKIARGFRSADVVAYLRKVGVM